MPFKYILVLGKCIQVGAHHTIPHHTHTPHTLQVKPHGTGLAVTSRSLREGFLEEKRLGFDLNRYRWPVLAGQGRMRAEEEFCSLGHLRCPCEESFRGGELGGKLCEAKGN